MAIYKKMLLSKPEDIAHFKVFVPTGISNEGLRRDGAFQNASTSGNFEQFGIPFFNDWSNIAIAVDNRILSASTMTIELASPMQAEKLHFLSFIAYSNVVENNIVVGHFRVYYEDETYSEVDLVAGVNISEWAYERPNVDWVMNHNEPMNLGYIFRTKIDANSVYNGMAFYNTCPVDTTKNITKIQLLAESGVTILISVPALTLEQPTIKSSNILVSATRPLNPKVGFLMLDTSLNKIITHTGGNAWIDAMGTTV